MQFPYPFTVSLFAFAVVAANPPLSQDISCYEKGEGLCVRDAPRSISSPSTLHGNLVRHEGDGDGDSSVSTSISPSTETGTMYYTVTVHHTMTMHHTIHHTMHHNCSCSAVPRSSTRPSDTPMTEEPASSISRSITGAPFKPGPMSIQSGTNSSPTSISTLTKRAENHSSEVAEIPNPTVFAQTNKSAISKPGDTFLGMARVAAIGAFVGMILFAVLLLASLIYCAIDRRRIKKRAERSEAKSRAISSGRTMYTEP